MEQQKFVRKNTALLDAQRRSERKHTRRTVFYILLFLSVSLVFLAVCVAVFLNIEEININGNEKYSYEDIIQYVSFEAGDNIFEFKASDVEEEIIKNLPYVGAVEIKRDLPTTVDINITEEKPFYAAELAGDTYILSPDLKVLECLPDTKAAKTGLVTLTLSNIRRCMVGSSVEFVSERNTVALTSLYAALTEVGIEGKIKSVDFKSRFDITFNYDDRFSVYVGDTDDISVKMRFLVAIIEELEPSSKGEINVSNPREASVSLS